jgi:lipopolysaccharide transport system permease protein
MERASLMVKINFKREIVVISALTMALINFGINLLIISVIGIILGVQITPLGIGFIFLICFTMFLGMYGISFFTSIWLVYIRDLAHISELVLQLMFYASAVFFPITAIPQKYQFIVKYNPIAIFIQAVRDALILGEVNRLKVVLFSLVGSVILVFVGRLYFNKKILKIAEHF